MIFCVNIGDTCVNGQTLTLPTLTLPAQRLNMAFSASVRVALQVSKTVGGSDIT